MRIIGFNFTKVLAERAKTFKPGEINTNIEFDDITEEETELAKDGSKAVRATFRFSVTYSEKDKKNSKMGEVSLTGFVILLSKEQEAEDLMKSWKKKELPQAFRLSIFNFLLKKCSTRALQLEEELNLPLHLPMPSLQPKK